MRSRPIGFRIATAADPCSAVGLDVGGQRAVGLGAVHYGRWVRRATLGMVPGDTFGDLSIARAGRLGGGATARTGQ
jgi:hypothetical protein